MNNLHEIPLPDTEGLYRARLDSRSIRLEVRSPRYDLRGLWLLALLLFAFLPLGLYVILLAALYQTDYTLHWGVHLLVTGLGTFFCLAVLQQGLGIMGFREAILRRRDGDTLVLEHHARGGRQRTYLLTEPVSFVVQFHHELGETSTSLDIVDEDGNTVRRHFRDVVGVELQLQAQSVTPPMTLMETGWCQFAPHRLTVYHEVYAPESNYIATVETARPLANAIRECLGIPVEFRVEGNAVPERLEAEGGI